MGKKVLVFAPHPDDAEFYAGGTLARWVSEGCRIHIVVATDGRLGSFYQESDTLVTLRRQEAMRAASVLGAEPPLMLGHADMGLDSLPPGILREQFARLIRQVRPDVVVAGDPFVPGEPHPDHRAAAWAASDALALASLPLWHPEHLAEGLQPHFVPEKYFYAETTPPSARIVDISATMDRKLAALAEHRSQMEFLVEDVCRQADLAGIDISAWLGDTSRDPMQAVSLALKAQAAEVGEKAGFQYAEAFRYSRFHPFIESLLDGDSRGIKGQS